MFRHEGLFPLLGSPTRLFTDGGLVAFNSKEVNMNAEKEFTLPECNADDRPLVKELLANIKKDLTGLEELLAECNDEWTCEDKVYRFYHGSFKVFELQYYTSKVVETLQRLLPTTPMSERFLDIIRGGTGKEFSRGDNENWSAVTRPILEAFFHARFFLEVAVKYGRELEYPTLRLPSGWAAFLYLYNLR
jgi:hypothetical protein